MLSVGVYYGEVDHWGHAVGPTGENVSSVIRQVDAQLVRLFNALESEKFPSDGKKLSERVNMMIFSDHGMTALVDRSSGVVRFDLSLVDSGDIVIGSTFGPLLQVYTSDNRVDAVRASTGQTLISSIFPSELYPISRDFSVIIINRANEVSK